MTHPALDYHSEKGGKMEINSTMPLENREDLSLAYTPGVAEPCKVIAADSEKVYDYTIKGHTVAVVSDGSAVLGLGNIGAEAALPVMEGKCLLFKKFAGIDAFPICLDTQNDDEIIETIVRIAPVFGGINLEDIAAPRCFYIEEALKKRLDIPVFHDDQHGTAIVVVAGLINALALTNRSFEDSTVVIVGAGAAGIAIARLLQSFSIGNTLLVDRSGIIAQGRDGLNFAKEAVATITNKHGKTGSLSDALVGADVFIGVSQAGLLTAEMIRTMNPDPIIFALANPDPEILPDAAKAAGAAIVATGRSDFPNQVNNVLAFPGIFKGALRLRSHITDDMKYIAAKTLAGLVTHPTPEMIIPSVFDLSVADTIAQAVTGV